MCVRENREVPLKIEEWQVDVNKKKLGPQFKKDAKAVETAIEALSQELREKLSLDLEKEGKVVIDAPGVGDGKAELSKDLITIEKRTRVENVREYTPNVIEPSFGIGRIVYVGYDFPLHDMITLSHNVYRHFANTATGHEKETKPVVYFLSCHRSHPPRF